MSETLWSLHRAAKKTLTEAGCESPAFDAYCLMTHCFGVRREDMPLRGGDPADETEQGAFFAAVACRAGGYPLQYILGVWEFMGLPFAVGEGVLIPRPDTEVLCEAALAFLAKRPHADVLDLCAGSGAIGLTIGRMCPGVRVTAVEKSPEALVFLRRNAAALCPSVTIREIDVLRPPEGFPPCDLIVANPPYIPSNEIASLQREVTHEPGIALNGGDDGLLFYRAICDLWLPLLKPGGALMAEIGSEQGPAVRAIFETSGLEGVTVRRDLAGLDRVVRGTCTGGEK